MGFVLRKSRAKSFFQSFYTCTERHIILQYSFSPLLLERQTFRHFLLQPAVILSYASSPFAAGKNV